MRKRFHKVFTLILRQPALAILLENTAVWFGIGLALGALASWLFSVRVSILGCASLFSLIPGYCGAYLLLLRHKNERI